MSRRVYYWFLLSIASLMIECADTVGTPRAVALGKGVETDPATYTPDDYGSYFVRDWRRGPTCPEAFHEGLAVAADGDGLYGYVNRTFRWVIRPRYARAMRFSAGRAVVRVSINEWSSPESNASEADGVIDRNGRFVVPPLYDSIGTYVGGRASADKQPRWGFINRYGEWVIKPVFTEVRGFSEGFAAVQFGDQWGFIRPDGTYLIVPQFEAAEDFSGGMTVVTCREISRSEMRLNPYGYVDQSGDWLLPCLATIPHEPPLAFAQMEGGGETSAEVDSSILSLRQRGLLGLYGIDALERRVRRRSPLLARLIYSGALDRLRHKYDRFYPPTEGLFVVTKDDLSGAIDSLGNAVIPLRSMSLEPFSEGLAAFNDGIICLPHRGFLNRQGRVAVSPKYYHVGPFREGLAVACIEEHPVETCNVDGCEYPKPYRCGFIDKSGKEVLPPDFSERGNACFTEWPGSFSGGLAPHYDRGWGYIDRSGAMQIPGRFFSARAFSDVGLAPAETPPKYLSLDRDGNVTSNSPTPEPTAARTYPEPLTDTYSRWNEWKP